MQMKMPYQDYIDANRSFSSPATLAEVQAMITAVNTAQTSIPAPNWKYER